MKKPLIIILIAWIGLLLITGLVVQSISSQIEHQGGLGKTIGKFIHDVNTEANKR